MKFFDFNFHLPCKSANFESLISQDLSMNSDSLIKCFDGYSDILNHLTGANFMIFNQLILPEDLKIFIDYVKRKKMNPYFTLLMDFRKLTLTDLKSFKENGINAIKFHSYQQKILESDFDAAIVAAKNAEALGLPILIDASYGSKLMYKYDNLKLATSILEEVQNVPVVLLHSGGARAIEALLIADSCSNVFLDTSYSVPYFLDSSIESDLKYAYKKIGADRVIYGSDTPYYDFYESLSKTELFFNNNSFSKIDKQIILCETYKRIFHFK